MKSIEIAGSIIVDNIYRINQYPKEGELQRIESIDRALGGLVPNDSIDIRKIDPTIKVFSSGCVGNDDLSKYVLDELSKHDIDVSNIKKVDDATSFSDIVSVNGGERTIFAYEGACKYFDESCISYKHKYLHLGYFFLLEKIDNGEGLKILKKAKELGITTSIDLVSSDSCKKENVLEVLPYVDNLIINEVEAAILLNQNVDENNLLDAARKLLNKGVKSRVILHMVKKCVCVTKDEEVEVDSLNIDPLLIKGATGAGDAFCSACLVGIINDLDNKRILKNATVIAASSLFAVDATSGVISISEVDDFIEKYNLE